MVRSLGVLLLALQTALGVQEMPWHPAKEEAPAAQAPVQYEYPEQVNLVVGKPQEVDLHFRVRDGLHINSHQPLDKSLIRTELVVAEPPGLDVQAVSFPRGTEFASAAFPGHPLSVYTGELVLHARLIATKPGEHMMEAALRYQACDANTCFPPRNAKVALDLIAR